MLLDITSDGHMYIPSANTWVHSWLFGGVHVDDLHQELGTPVNIIDKIAMKLFDLTNADRLKTVFRAVCRINKIFNKCYLT
jgi:hypothetical protein